MNHGGNACTHGLCDPESMCRHCRFWGYGEWPEVTDRLDYFLRRLESPKPMTYDTIQELRDALAEARAELIRRREAEAREAKA